jgi:hypothetical protein
MARAAASPGRRPADHDGPQACTGILPPLVYPDHFVVKRVTNAGTIRFKTRLL